MNVVMTSGKDGYVKVWSNQNELIREMNFATPIYASCFANERGDILVGFGTHICSVSLVNYLPLDYLKEVCSVSNFCTEDDVRELPVKFDHSSEPWLDICNLAHYSVDIVQRRRQRLEEEVIDKFKKATKKESAKFVIFVDGKTTRVIRKDFADRLLVWAKGKQKLKFGVKTVDTASLSTDISSNVKRKAADNVSQKKKNDTLRKLSRTGSSVKERKKTYFDSGGSLEIYPSAVGKALKELNQQKRLGAEEMRLLKEQELLKRDPIIAPDGYIPNSVIRKKLKTHGGKIDDALRKERPFQLKPVPKANPQHMPAWWAYEEEDKEQSTTQLEYRVMKWDDTPSPTPRSVISSVSSVSLKSLIESPVKKYIAEGRTKTISPKSPKSKSDVKSRTQSVSKSRNDTTPVENVKKMIKANDKNRKSGKYTWDSTSSEGLSRSKPTSGQRSYTNLSESSTLKAGKTKPGTPTAYKMISPSSLKMTPLMKAEVKSKRIELSRLDYDSRTSGRRSGAQSEAREKSFKLTNYAVDEDSSAIHVKESKSGRRLKSHMSHVIIQQLLQEEWMPEIGRDFELGDIINILVKVLSDQNNSDVYDKACTYVTNMFHELGLTEEQMDQIIGKLGVNLDNSNTAIKKFTLQTLQNIGQGRNDVLMLILPKLVDQDESIKGAAIEAIRVLTGAHDKETLLNFLESVGITSAEYRSREDQEYSLAMLAERFGEHEDPEVFHRIQNWVADTTPGLFDEDRDDDELWQDSRSRKEHSIMSEGKSGKKDGPLTPRSKGAASTFRKRMKETDGFSTISDRSSSSRKSRRSGSRQDLFSEVQSRASTEGMPLPYTLPSQARDSVLSRTPSGKSHLKISKKMSPKEDMLVTSEEPDETYIKSPDIEEEPVEIEAELGQVVEKAKTVGTEPTTVSMDTNTGSVDTQLVSKGTPANTPEAPFAKNEMDLFAQEVAVTNDNPYLEPITEDIENASFLKTPRNADSAIPMESTAIDKTGMGRANEGQKLSRYFTCGM
ncbi:uncharacterized protein LOC132726366 isoform X6 [Ruditapes philippinarum]|uniref:uncharacterized protein LOC132726366 isoform X6 n=1 Tax=Ruditapes philippinarum TaxID=129788 RepID=UPI00295B26D2|nr:uncharacterized protein LOC132726366 isoform X6 [Ruditapes philippinarum]